MGVPGEADPRSLTAADDTTWRQLGIPDAILHDAIAAFGTPETAARWVRVLNEADPPTVTYWRDSDYLSRLRESGLSPDDFEEWASGGISVYQILHLSRFLSLKDAVTTLHHWAPPELRWPQMLAGSELIELLNNGFDLERLKVFAADGLTGHDVYGWRKSQVPSRDWIAWHSLGIHPEDAGKLFYEAGVTEPDKALQWIETGLAVSSIRDYRSRGWSPDQAIEGIRPASRSRNFEPSLPGLKNIDHQSALVWTDLFARPRSSSPVFAARSGLPAQLEERLRRALDDLGSYGVVVSNMFDHTYRGLAFLDGGWAKRSPYGLNGRSRQWIVGVEAMALVCHRLRADLPRRGRFKEVPAAEELESRWQAQRMDRPKIEATSQRLAESAFRPQLEELAIQLRGAI